MTEPVAWRYKNVNQKVWCVSQMKPDDRAWGIIEPLYTAEQLHPRVKMTQAEFDEWVELDFENNIFGFLSQLLDDVTEPDYPNLTNRIYGSNGDGIEDNSRQLELCELWANYNPDTPEETIEIVPETKWFVRSKDKNDEGYYSFLNNVIQLTLNWVYSKDKNKPHKEAVSFDTKEQAELWVNPLTEAVQLPVEGE